MADSDKESNQDIEQGIKKEKQAHEQYQIPSSICKQDIEKNYDEIHDGIEKLNHQLLNLFKKKEHDLCNEYKREMTKAQKKLRELQEQSSESELNKRKIEKKEKLQKERKEFLEKSIQFSNECKQLKDKLSNVLNTTKDLEGEINFLNEQIVFADKHNEQLQCELNNLRVELKKRDPDINLDNLEEALILPNNKQKFQQEISEIKNTSKILQNASQLQNNSIITNNNHEKNENNTLVDNKSYSNRKYVSPYCKKQIAKPNQNCANEEDIQKAQEELMKQKEINQKLTDFLNDPCFQETEFEKIFMDCVSIVKQRKNNNQNKLPYVKSTNETQSVSNQGNFNESTVDFTTISELDFNEFNKRQILEEFLSREEIKKYLYSLIFSNSSATHSQQQYSKKQNY